MEDDHKQRQDEWLISISLNRNVTGFKRAQLLAVPQRQRESVMRRRRAKKKKTFQNGGKVIFYNMQMKAKLFFREKLKWIGSGWLKRHRPSIFVEKCGINGWWTLKLHLASVWRIIHHQTACGVQFQVSGNQGEGIFVSGLLSRIK